jgi:hypothetical protein
MTLFGLSVTLALLAFFLVEETVRVRRSTVIGLTRRSVWIGTALASLTVALVLPRLIYLLV